MPHYDSTLPPFAFSFLVWNLKMRKSKSKAKRQRINKIIKRKKQLENNGRLKTKQMWKYDKTNSKQKTIHNKNGKKTKMQKVKKTMVIKLFNAALQLASYRKSKTHYKRHPVLTHARKTGYNPRYSCWILYAPYANEPK